MRASSGFVLALASLSTGCGLLLDTDPPDRGIALDGGARDAGTADRDAGDPPDAAARDAGSGDAAHDGGASDAGQGDAGPGDAGTPVVGDPCRSTLDCPAGTFCQRPRGQCYGEGACAPVPAGCAGLFDPVCGCDWGKYSSPCEAAARGVNVMQDDDCPVVGIGGRWCSTEPDGSDPAGCLRCFDDADCGGLAPICVASSCELGAPGVCALGPPPPGDCYDDRQCREAQRCVGAVIDVCPPQQGRCEDSL